MTRCTKCGRENAPYIEICPKCGNSLSTSAKSQAIPFIQSAVTNKYAGFWRRFAACLIDAFLISVAFAVVAYIAGAVLGLSWWEYRGADNIGYHGSLGTFIGIILAWLYDATMESSPYQATLGKMLLGIIVTDLQGDRVSFARATGRHFGKFMSGMLLCVGYIIAGFTKKKQALHDMMANTLVVCKNNY